MSFKDLSGFMGKAISALMEERSRVDARSAGTIMKEVFARMPSKDRPSFSPTSDPEDEERDAIPSTAALENSIGTSSCDSLNGTVDTERKKTTRSNLHSLSPGLDDKLGTVTRIERPYVVRVST